MKIGFKFIVAVLLAPVCATAIAQKSGQSIQIQYGKVVSATYVQEKSDAGKAALLGGAIGYGLTRNRSTSTKVLATAAGAGIAGGGKKRAEGSREARQYEVETSSGIVVIISDQTEIQIDDCVVVENPGNTNANIRRMDSAFCEPESAEVVAELQEEIIEEAEECASAKRELAAAQTDEAFDRAMRKVEILCNM